MNHWLMKLLSPDETGTGGGGPTNESAPATPSDPGTAAGTEAPQPASQPAGHQISDEQFEAYRRADGKARASDQFYGRLKERGIDTFDGALDALDSFQKLQTDPATSRILEAISTPAHAEPLETTQQQAPFDERALEALVDQKFQARDRAQFETDFNQRASIESSLIDKAAADGKLKAIFGESSFSDVRDGKAGTPAAQAVARLLEHAIVDRSPVMNGASMPVTNPATVAEAVNDVMTAVSAFKAMTLMEASTSAPDLSRPNTDGFVQQDGTPLSPAEAKARLDAEANATFDAEMKRVQAELSGGPASQGF